MIEWFCDNAIECCVFKCCASSFLPFWMNDCLNESIGPHPRTNKKVNGSALLMISAKKRICQNFVEYLELGDTISSIGGLVSQHLWRG